jgi:uncharacterized protein YbjT (DUF2867 family)
LGENPKRLILVTGATGYVGGRLVPRLLAAGYRVRCLARDPSRLQGRGWTGAEVVQGDVLDPGTLAPAMEGVDSAFYLVHSMAAGKAFELKDRKAAANFREAASRAGVGRIIYLGGLASLKPGLSKHLRSRLETGETLRFGPVPVTEFQASVIVGSGSLSFEMVRYLAERLPLLIAPRWVSTRCQPIGIRDVLSYLVASIEEPRSAGRVVEIGGSDVVTYRDMMLEYARARKLHRRMITVPVLTPRLSSLWLGLVTPIPGSVARQLIDGLRNETVCRSETARELFPQIRPMSFREALSLALQRLENHEVETVWTGAFSSEPRELPPPVVLTDEQGLNAETRSRLVDAPPEKVFDVVARIGGNTGWYYADFMWKIRGFMDWMIGGVGMRRGRRHPSQLRVGDPLDFWRVEAWDPPRLIRLRAEMKVPGLAWLQFTVEPREGGKKSLLVQKALFAPRGLLGFHYWWALYPIHGVIFSGMVNAIAQRAEKR